MSDDLFELLGGPEPITVNLDAYAIPDDHVIFKCSPGKTYRFYLAVRDARVVFPDIRGLDTLEGSPDQWTDEQVLGVIAADRWQRELESRGRGNEEQGVEGVSKLDRRTLTFLKRIFFEGRKGDLVVVPVEGYAKDVLIGELLTDCGDVRAVEAKDGDYFGVYFGRPVRWRTAVQKLALSEDLIKALHTQAAVFALARSLHEEVYRHAYGNFVFKGNFVAEFKTSKQKFTAEDMSVVSTWLNGFDYLRHQMALQPGAAIPEQMGFFQMGLEPVPDDEAAELQINIQSPGEIFVRSLGPFALALMAMLPLAACSPAEVVNNGVTVHLKKVGGATTDAQGQVEECVNAMAKALGECRLEEANALGTRAENNAGVSAAAALKVAPKGSK